MDPSRPDLAVAGLNWSGICFFWFGSGLKYIFAIPDHIKGTLNFRNLTQAFIEHMEHVAAMGRAVRVPIASKPLCMDGRIVEN
jgi:hypothetical protein